MKNKRVQISEEDRKDALFPFLKEGLADRLIKSEAIDLTNNVQVKREGRYWVFSPIDGSKKIKK